MKRGMRPWAASGGVGRVLAMVLAAGVVWASWVWEVEAQTPTQQRGDILGSVGAGGTLYTIDTRINEGGMVRGSLGYALARAWAVEAGVRRHGCFDCDQFWILDAGVQWQRPGERFSPFVSAGGGRASDPGFMGTEWGTYASVGSWMQVTSTSRLQLEIRVRQLGYGMGSPNGMGELTLGVTRRVWTKAP